jgi:hypothetical protein
VAFQTPKILLTGAHLKNIIRADEEAEPSGFKHKSGGHMQDKPRLISIFISRSLGLFLILLAAVFICCRKTPEPADLVLLNGTVFTADLTSSMASGLAVKGNRIAAVCSTDREARRYIGQATRVIDLEGKFVSPGIIDAHVHFNRAGSLINDANLMTVSDEGSLRKEIGRVVGILGEGEWITEGLWGAYEQWDLGDAGGRPREEREPWRPSKAISGAALKPENWPISRSLTGTSWPFPRRKSSRLKSCPRS